MERLLNFLYHYRAFFTFLLLEVFCSWLIIENNQYQSTRYFNSSNQLAATIIGWSHSVREYFSLRDINESLAKENALLRSRLEKKSQLFPEVPAVTDSAVINRFEYLSAKVVNNSTKYYKNFITINKGKANGLEAGMAVISAVSAVGKVKSVSDHFAVLISLLNIDEQVSSSIKGTGHFGTVQWDGTDPRLISLKYIPRHANPHVGDTVVTSGYNAVFPAGILVGIIRDVKLKDEALFYDLKVELAQDFSKLAFVEVIKSNLKTEIDSLEKRTIGDPK